MNEIKWLSRLLSIGATLEALVGLALVVTPSPVVQLLLGAPMADSELVVARLAGGGLLALGIACWFARTTPTSPAGLGIAGALLVYNIVACVALALSQIVPTSRDLALGASALHGLLAVGLLAALIMRKRHRAGSW